MTQLASKQDLFSVKVSGANGLIILIINPACIASLFKKPLDLCDCKNVSNLAL